MFLRLTLAGTQPMYYNVNQIMMFGKIDSSPESQKILEEGYKTQLKFSHIDRTLYCKESVVDINKSLAEKGKR